MRTPRAEAWYAAIFAALAAAATAAIIATRGESASVPVVASVSSQSWRDVLGVRPQIDVGGRVIVVLKTPSLGERVAAESGALDIQQEQAWTKVELSAQRLLLARLAVQGVVVHPEERFARVLDGFSAVVPPDVVPIVERDANVAGVYPVRIAYPAAVVAPAARAAAIGDPLASAAVDGRGVTIALLDTGVARSVPFLRGRLLPEIDVAGAGSDEHGTAMAAVIARVAPGASVQPIRVAGAYARSDQVIAGLERAVDPNGDGDAHDAARIALVALAEPFAGFADGPEALAAAGASDLNVLVVAPSGNDGLGGASYGDVAAPGGAPSALTVGALDTRPLIAEARVVVRAGLQTLFDATAPLAGDAIPRRDLELRASAPNGRLFTRHGGSVVAGRAALLPVAAPVQAAAEAGASALLLYGRTLLPAGALGGSVRVPAFSLPAGVARRIHARLAAGALVTVAIGRGRQVLNTGAGHVAPFSSTGLAFDGSVKPDVVAPGVAVPAFGGLGVDGSSAAAAVAAASAALLAQTRPSLGADALGALLVGTARPLTGDPVTAQGAGEIDAGQAAAGEVAASPPTLALGTSTAPGRTVHAAFTLTNLSSRTLHLDVAIRTQHEGAATVDFTVRPRRVTLGPAHTVLVHVDALTASQAVGDGTADGAVVATIAGGGSVRIPWALAFAPATREPLVGASFSQRGLRLIVDAGRVTTVAGVRQIEPLARLDVLLATPSGKQLGVLDRIRDVLPGRYTFQLTGFGPGGKKLASGSYVATVVAYPADGSAAGSRSFGFVVR
ncbi:MAG TPA: S8 family serine peptidase [Gaiellaceae bacterium]